MITKNKKTNFFFNIINQILHSRAKEIISRIFPYLKNTRSILDIGAGSCHIASGLLDKGYRVVPIDVSNESYLEGINSTIYNGINIPFENQSFDTAIIITVLHHTKNPEQIIQEACRTSKEIIIIEDVVVNKIHKYITWVYDSLLNLEFFGHPHSNKTDLEWKKIFTNLNLELLDTHEKWSFVFMYQVTYHLRNKN